MTARIQDLTLHAVAPDDEAALRERFALMLAAQQADRPADPPPCWTAHRAHLAAPWPGTESRVWLARAGGETVGVGSVDLPVLDYTGNALVGLLVAPAHRRRGIGRWVLAHLAEEARRAGRVRMIGEAGTPLDGPPSAGALFAAGTGAREAIVDVRRRLHLPGPPEQETARRHLALEASAAAGGYDLVQWVGATPVEWLDDIARLAGRMSTDAPLGDLHWEPEHYDADRVRTRNTMCEARGVTVMVTAARGPDGRLAAFTEIGKNATVPWHAWNWDTLVLPEHRGRRLGMFVKLANLALLRERFPAVRSVDTVNAAVNSHMIAINEAIGFRPHDLLGEWQLDL